MYKRLITFAATLLCIAACALGFVACNKTVAVESVMLDKTAVTLQVGGEETLTVTVTLENATDKAVTWSSDNTAVATVANGKVTAVSAGSATVTATAGDKSATCIVTVETVKTVTSEQWEQAMESAEQFVIEMKQGEMTNAIKIDGDKRMQAFGNEMYLYVKETLNDEIEYFSYYYDGTKWEKTVIDESDYSQTAMYAEITTYFKDHYYAVYEDGTVYDYTQFESEQWNKNKWYDTSSAKKFLVNAYGGVYLDSFIDVFANFSFDKVLNAYVGDIDVDTTGIVTADGKIVSVVVGTYKLEFSDYGTTVINLPKAA